MLLCDYLDHPIAIYVKKKEYLTYIPENARTQYIRHLFAFCACANNFEYNNSTVTEYIAWATVVYELPPEDISNGTTVTISTDADGILTLC